MDDAQHVGIEVLRYALVDDHCADRRVALRVEAMAIGRVGEQGAELRLVLGVGRIPEVLLPDRDDELVHERVPHA